MAELQSVRTLAPRRPVIMPARARRDDAIIVSRAWHHDGMARARISTTVDRNLLDDARRLHAGTTDAELIDEALAALLGRYRTAEIDAAYAAAYEADPIDGQDDWGDLASFRRAASTT